MHRRTRAQGAFEYLLMIGGIMGIVVVAFLITTGRVSVAGNQARTNQVTELCFSTVGCRTNLTSYYDAGYPLAYVAASDSLNAYLAANGFQSLNAAQLKAWMTDRIARGPTGAPKSAVVITMGAAPDTVLENQSTTNTFRRFLDAGGTVIWVGDVPLVYQGTPGGLVSWGVNVAGNMLGYDLLSGEWGGVNTACPLTATGTAMKMTNGGQGGNFRAVNQSALGSNSKVLANATATGACTYLQNYNGKYPYSGLVVIGTASGGYLGSDAGLQSNVLALATYYPGK